MTQFYIQTKALRYGLLKEPKKWRLPVKRFRFLAVLLLAGLLSMSCGDDDGGSSGGSGVADTDPNLNAAIQQAVDEVNQQAAAEQAATTEATSAGARGSYNFDLRFIQTVQPCASCGIWFDSAQLVINYSGDNNKPYTKVQRGNLLIKQASGRVGRFQANLSSIPASAAINKATLFMRLNTAEGIANSDNSSVIEVYDNPTGAFVRRITAAEDIKGKGYSKGNPNVPIDFTAYAKQVFGQ